MIPLMFLQLSRKHYVKREIGGKKNCYQRVEIMRLDALLSINFIFSSERNWF